MAFDVETRFGNYTVYGKTHSYIENRNLAIQLYDAQDHSPFARLTVNLGWKLPENQAFVDTNNCPWAEKFIKENGLGKPLNKFESSGYCDYPLYEFNLEKFR